MLKTFKQFLPAIKKLPAKKPFSRTDLVTEQFLLHKDNDLSMFYAPHNEYINKKAKVVIVGITPGWNQMKTAYESFVRSLAANNSLEWCLKEAKRAASFAGSMRTNLCEMLNQIHIPHALHLLHATALFESHRHLLHTTSVIKYPVFIKGKNYTGHQPPIVRSPQLQHYAYSVFPKELAQIPSPTLLIPLGKTVESVLVDLMANEKLPNRTCLFGFPHPSGANGHRVKQFQQRKEHLQKVVLAWAEKIT